MTHSISRLSLLCGLTLAAAHAAAATTATVAVATTPVRHAGVPVADTAPPPSVEAEALGWNGSGELGFASARGNSSTETFNGKFNAELNEDDWVHHFDLFGLRASAEYTPTDSAGNPLPPQRRTTAMRYTVGAGSGLKLDEHRQLTSALRYERDDFAAYEWQRSVSVGYGTRLLDAERSKLDVQIGPGFKQARNSDDDRVESGLIGRGFIDFRYALTGTTSLGNTLLVESGGYNTFAQNDLGLSVAMNEHLALKAGMQGRYNSEVTGTRKKTDTLTTMNVVYKFR